MAASLLALVLSAQDGPVSDLRCGGYCLYCGLKALDIPIGSYADVEKRLGPPGEFGYSMGQLADVAEQYGVHTSARKTDLDELAKMQRPFVCIAHTDGAHFLLLAGTGEGSVRIIDPPREYSLPVDTLRARWDGKALLLSQAPISTDGTIGGLIWISAVASIVVVLLGAIHFVRRYRRF